jgi:hypothetical protein
VNKNARVDQMVTDGVIVSFSFYLRPGPTKNVPLSVFRTVENILGFFHEP